MRLLLVEDNQALSDWLARMLRRDNYVVDCVHDGEAADACLRTHDYALVILDLALPARGGAAMGGLEVLRRMRGRRVATPVIVLTANDAMSSRVGALDSGADDYIVKPFDVDELEARIRAQLRRGHAAGVPLVTHGALSLDTAARSFTLAGNPLALTPREHAVLETLLLRAGRPVPKTALAESVFGFDDEADHSAVEIYVHRVRKKLEGGTVGIVTLRGLGYMLRVADGG
ncbi:MAG: DNA-binding response regulator [Acetobacteraceae bacterium SCN 69-10]|nr:response regulator [Rhodospirillales bacterium]ODU56675.1 MAG: DNA-binding response regulator [Acetobacteraceae bacterium SCN 69-10]OJY76283.1 MAG: DNA-binding response regulator [Rhodospirillales bacterium 70-18]